METVYAWIKDKWRPVKSRRSIRRGKNRGKMEVELYDGKKRVVTIQEMRGGVFVK